MKFKVASKNLVKNRAWKTDVIADKNLVKDRTKKPNKVADKSLDVFIKDLRSAPKSAEIIKSVEVLESATKSKTTIIKK